ncbi:MAG: P-type conjugative transfer ATPase TrbB [Thiobacillaceae bacterium]
MTATNAQVFHGRQIEALRRQLGDDVLGYLEDPSIVEIMLNPDGCLWVDVLGRGMERRDTMDPVRGQMVMDTVAAMLGTVVTASSPILEGELPLDGSRFEGLMPPVVERPVFTIRKKALLIFTLDDYVTQGIMTSGQAEALMAAIHQRQNILIAGGTGTGKTTLANALLHAIGQISPDHRLVIIEDTRELQCAAPNVIFLRTSEGVDMIHLLRATMRMRPDRIVVGEVRGAEALALLKAWNTGHPGGIGTVHANDAQAALIRVGQLIQEANVPPNPELIAETVNVVVSIKRTATGRTVDQILRVAGYKQGVFTLEPGFDRLEWQ